MENYYKILNCDESASYEQLKQAYRKLVKEHHPDKRNNALSETYDKIDIAWQVLRNAESRKVYDAKLVNNALNTYTYEKLQLNEMEYHADTYTYNCRCGGTYILSKNSLEEFQEYIVECDECSFTILVVKSENCGT